MEEESDMAAIDSLVERFATPLEAAQADTDAKKTEFGEMIAYAVQYIAVSYLDYNILPMLMYLAAPYVFIHCCRPSVYCHMSRHI